MSKQPCNLHRFFKYSAVGLLGLCLKFAVLICLHGMFGLGYMVATALAVETVVLHNYIWHLRWTWRDRSRGISQREILARMLRFHLGNGVVAMITNLAVMRILVGQEGVHYVAANLLATAGAGIANFIIADFLVFVAPHQQKSPRVGNSPASVTGSMELEYVDSL